MSAIVIGALWPEKTVSRLGREMYSSISMLTAVLGPVPMAERARFGAS